MKKAKKIGDYVHNRMLLDDYPIDDYPINEEIENYLLFLGKINVNKGTHHAIEVAKRTRIQLIIAGIVQKDARKYFKKQIELHIDNNLIRYVGPVGGEKKLDLLKNAKFVLFPITWFEPFGLVPIEAMACGTPAICFRKGGVKETMKGFPELVCNTVEEMVEIINKKDLPEPKKLRTYVERNFSAKMMTENYLKLYEKAIKEYKK